MDIILIIVLMLGAIQGFRKGLLVTATSFLAYFIGLYVAYRFSFITAAYLQEHHPEGGTFIDATAFAVTFFTVVILLVLIANALTKILQAAQLNFINRITGMAFGILQWAFFASVGLYVYSYISPLITKATDKEQVDTKPSVLAPYISPIAPFVYPFLKEWKDNLKSQKEQQNVENLE